MKNIVLVIIIILVISSLSCVCATEDNCTLENITSVDYLRTIQDNFNKIVDNFHNHLDRNFNIKNINNNANNSLNINIYYNKSNLVNLSTNKDKHNVGLFNGTLYNQSQYNRSSKLGLNNNSFVNNVSKELNISKEVNLTNNSIDPKLNNLINNSSNIYHNKSNLVNLSTDKNKQGIDLFNDNLYNKNQYNKTFKLLGLNHSVNNDSIFNNKELNISKSNSNICDDSREDNLLINPVPESNNKDNMMFLIPILLVLLGAIIVYKIKK